MAVKGHVKGAEFERKVCKRLSLWVSHGESDAIFWRTAMSGGRRTIGLRTGRGDRSSQAGDVGMVDSRGDALVSRFVIECKFYEDLEIGGFIFGKGFLNRFWKKLVGQAEKEKRLPMLIAKQNHRPEIVCLDLNGICSFTRNFLILGDIGGCSLVLLSDLLKQSPPRKD